MPLCYTRLKRAVTGILHKTPDLHICSSNQKQGTKKPCHKAEPFFKGNLTLPSIIEMGPQRPLGWRRGPWTRVDLATSYSRSPTDTLSRGSWACERMSNLQEEGLRFSDEIRVLHFLPDGHWGLHSGCPVGTDDTSLFLPVSTCSPEAVGTLRGRL